MCPSLFLRGKISTVNAVCLNDFWIIYVMVISVHSLRLVSQAGRIWWCSLQPVTVNSSDVTWHYDLVALCTMSHKKEPTYFCNIVKNQRILTPFSLLDLKMNGTRDGMNFHPPHLSNIGTPPCESRNTKNVKLQWYITKDSCTRFIIALLKCTMVMCLIFSYLGYCAAVCVQNKDSWHRWPAKTFDANSVWLRTWHYRCCSMWHDHLWSCVHAGGGHFECMLWSSFIWFITYYKTVNGQSIDAFNGYSVVNIRILISVRLHFWCFNFHKVV